MNSPADPVLNSYTIPASGSPEPQLPAYTYIVREEGKTLVDSMAYTDQALLDRTDLLDTARTGLQTLQAFRATAEADRKRFTPRIKDYFRHDTPSSVTRIAYMLHDLGVA